MLRKEPVLQPRLASSGFVDALELQRANDVHEYWICWLVGRSWLSATRALIVFHLPVSDALDAKKLILALATLDRLLVFGKDLVADEAHDLIS